MGKRLLYGECHDSCLDKLKPGEPFFVLRGQDKLAPDVIRYWARMAQAHGLSSEKVKNAFDLAEEMISWHPRKYPD